VNVGVFLTEVVMKPGQVERFVFAYGLIPNQVESAPLDAAVRLFTSMFIHGGWLHILGNMWIFFIFGDNVEDRMGRVRFLVFYLVCGIAGGLLHVFFYRNSGVPVVGASAAISGVLGAYFLMFPHSRVLTLVPVFIFPLFVELPAMLFLALWFFLQLLSGHLALQGGAAAEGVAWWGHIGGFVTGMILHRLFLWRR
jgi:membrane associated rhomboid family serine protease